MPKYNVLGHVIPDDQTDPPSLETAIDNLSLSNPGYLVAGSAAEANAKRDAYLDIAGNEHIVNPPPLMVFRTDLDQLHAEFQGGWRYLAGPQHAARITWRREDVPQNPSTPLVLYGIQFLNATSAWTFNSAQNLVIPETGMYAVSFDANLTGAAGTAGREFFQFSTTDGQVSHRISASNENNFGGGIEVWHLRKGQQMRVQVYHEGGGARTWSGTMTIAMVAATPDW